MKSFDDTITKTFQPAVLRQLGIVAQAQRQWLQADQHDKKALELYLEFDDRHAQASMYYDLGTLSEEQGQESQAELCYQKALEIYVESNDYQDQPGVASATRCFSLAFVLNFCIYL